MDARTFAIKKHEYQMYGSLPYIIHLQEVFLRAQSYDLSQEELDSAYLHDTLEDTQTSFEELVEKFGTQTADIVWRVTGIGNNRAECTKNTFEKLTTEPINVGAINTKMVDRMSNVEASIRSDKKELLKLYLKEQPIYDAVFQKGNPVIYQDLALTYQRASEFLEKVSQPKEIFSGTKRLTLR